MKKSHFTDQQIAFAVQQAEAGVAVEEVFRNRLTETIRGVEGALLCEPHECLRTESRWSSKTFGSITMETFLCSRWTIAGL